MTQLVTKFIADNAVTGSKIRLANNQTLRARNAANTADVDLLKLDSANLFTFTSLPYADSALAIPTSEKQFATVEYIKNYVLGKTDAKDAVSYLSDSNIGGTFSAGDSVTPASISGATALIIDGKTFSDTDVMTPYMRIALTGQTSALQNGIYDLTAAGASSYTLTRSSDFDGIYNEGGQEVSSGAYFSVINGTVYAGYEILLTTPDPIVINTTALTFVKYPSVLSLTGGDMIVKNGNDFSVDLQTNGGLESSNPGNQAGQLRIKTDSLTQALEKDRTIQVDTSNNALTGRRSVKQMFTLTSTDITNQYIDLTGVAGDMSVDVVIDGGGIQSETADYTVNYTGGTGGKTRLTFAGGLATAGVSALAAGDVFRAKYSNLLS